VQQLKRTHGAAHLRRGGAAAQRIAARVPAENAAGAAGGAQRQALQATAAGACTAEKMKRQEIGTETGPPGGPGP